MQFVPVGWIHNGAFLLVIWFMNKKIVEEQLLARKKDETNSSNIRITVNRNYLFIKNKGII